MLYSKSNLLYFRDASGNEHQVYTTNAEPTEPMLPSPRPSVPKSFTEGGIYDEVLTLEYTTDLKKFRKALMIYEDGRVVEIRRGEWKHKTIFN